MSGKTNVFAYLDMRGGDKEQCWPWLGALGGKSKRPYVRHNGKTRLAYHVVWELVNGEPIGVRLLRHKCDNPQCCNPYHLIPGTQRQNMDDMKKRERHGIPKIVKNAWLNLAAQGVNPNRIGKLYGVSPNAVRQFLKGATAEWKEANHATLASEDEDGERDEGARNEAEEDTLSAESSPEEGMGNASSEQEDEDEDEDEDEKHPE